MGKFSIRYTKEKRDPPFAFKFNNNNYINGKIVIVMIKRKIEKQFQQEQHEYLHLWCDIYHRFCSSILYITLW